MENMAASNKVRPKVRRRVRIVVKHEVRKK